MGPFKTLDEAEDDMAAELTRLGGGGQVLDRSITLGRYLDRWLSAKVDLKDSTYSSYAEAINLYFKPALGHLRMVDLRGLHVEELVGEMRKINRPVSDAERPSEMLRRLLDARADDERRELAPGESRRKKSTRPLTPARIKRIIAVLNSALNAAVKSGVIATNPVKHVALPRAKRVRPLVWTEERIARWRKTGKVPSRVMVWTPQQTGAFLDFVADKRLYPLFHVTAFRGLRRAEVIGLPWSEVDLENGLMTIRETAPDDDPEDAEDPKSEAGERIVSLDSGTVAILEAWRARQAAERLACGQAWVDTGLVFTREDGRALRPGWVSERFETFTRRAGLPPIRFHDLRHGAATLSLAAGVDMKVVSETLGHSRSSFTADVYTSVVPQVAQAAAEAVVTIVPRKKAAPQ